MDTNWVELRKGFLAAQGQGENLEEVTKALASHPWIAAKAAWLGRIWDLQPADIEDLEQAVRLYILRKFARVRVKSNLEGLLHSVIRTVRRRMFRRRAWWTNPLPPDLPGPQVEGRDTELEELVKILIEGMRPKYRNVLRLCLLKGMKRQEVARVLGMTQDAVQKTFQRGREVLKEQLRRRGWDS